MKKSSFEPLVGRSARYLILGSLPGDLSIARASYYAHPQNRFWKLMFAIFDESYSQDYEIRKRLLISHSVALWDVCATAWRPGSMDTAIREVIVNPIPQLIQENPSIEHVFFNGKKAMQLYALHLPQVAGVNYQYLPSTSPANASFKFEQLLFIWKEALGSR